MVLLSLPELQSSPYNQHQQGSRHSSYMNNLRYWFAHSFRNTGRFLLAHYLRNRPTKGVVDFCSGV